MHNEAFSKSFYAVLTELLYFFFKLKKVLQNLCAGGSLYYAHPAKEHTIIYVSKVGYCR